jgi:hypothetical protein
LNGSCSNEDKLQVEVVVAVVETLAVEELAWL